MIYDTRPANSQGFIVSLTDFNFSNRVMYLSKFCPTYPHAGNLGEYEGI